MLLFVGLGNPTPNSENNRHNIGFKIIDAINNKFKLSKQKPKFKGLLTTGSINNKKVYAIKPLTFMNNSGICIRELMEYFKIDAEDVIVFHDDLDIDWYRKVDTSKFDTPPIWEFWGLEDARLVRWDNKLYMTGVRRDCNTIGSGRMELSEIEIADDQVVEVSRTRVPIVGEPGENQAYCEKNWMPIIDKPYHYVKWGNPTEVVKFDMKKDRTIQIAHTDYETIPHDLRGGSQVIPFRDGYLGLHHITYLTKVPAGRRDGKYRHQFTYWDKNWNPIKRSKVFSFLSGKVEFTCGLAEYQDSYLITFGFMDNAAYILKTPKKVLEEFIDAE